MDKERIISAVSIEFGLSREQSEAAVNNIFTSINQLLRKNKNLEIQKFGKFKLIQDNGGDSPVIKFIPSKKLSQRVNSNFENLTKVKMKNTVLQITDEKQIEPAKEEITELVTGSDDNIVVDLNSDEDEIVITEAPRKLISDDVIKLHNEITEEKEDNPSGTNLWG